MKTKEQIEAEIKKLNTELEAVKKEEEALKKAEAEKAEADFLVNFNPKNIKRVLDFFEDEEKCEKFLKNPTNGELKYGVEPYDFPYRKNKLEFFDWVIEVVDQEGGGEGEGEHWHCVFKVEREGVLHGYYYIPGYYQSYNGTEIEWSATYEVEPFDKVVVDWRAKK
jgi:hypothetical protein